MNRIVATTLEANAEILAPIKPSFFNNIKLRLMFKMIAESSIKKVMIVFFLKYKRASKTALTAPKKYERRISGEKVAAVSYFAEARMIKSSFEMATYPNHIGMMA